MSDNNHIPDIEVEPLGNGKYRVTKNGVPQTGPLDGKQAVREADKMARGYAFQAILIASIIMGIITYAISRDLSTALFSVLVTFLTASVIFLFRTR